MDKKFLTVFTPTYNRAYIIHKCYESLCRQTCKDFIWLIIDDGSTDETAELINLWETQNNGFEIRYIYKENGGMHTAHNLAYKEIDTELNVCIDSDDYMPDDAVEKILNFWRKYGGEKYAGIIALDIDKKTNKIIGKRLPDLKSITLTDYYENGGSGDKKLIYRTDVINAVPPYPEFTGEKYVGLAYKYHLIDQKYKLLILNEPVCVVEYQQDGSSNNMYRQYLKNPKGFAFYRKSEMILTKSKKRCFIECIHYVSSSIILKNKNFISESPRKLFTVCAIPFGLLLYFVIKIKEKMNDS